MKRIACLVSASAMLLVSFAFSANAAVKPEPIREYGKQANRQAEPDSRVQSR